MGLFRACLVCQVDFYPRFGGGWVWLCERVVICGGVLYEILRPTDKVAHKFLVHLG